MVYPIREGKCQLLEVLFVAVGNSLTYLCCEVGMVFLAMIPFTICVWEESFVLIEFIF